MAKIVLSALISNISGSIGGVTFATGSNGLYVRSKSRGANRNTAIQQDRRYNLASYAANWRGLTDAERTSWIEAAYQFPYVDSLGVTKRYTGYQLYIKTNMVLVTAAIDT